MKKLQITAPEMFEVVGFDLVVSGKVNPAHMPVQVYVMAADGKWYLQKPAVKTGNKWSVDCHIGFEAPEDFVYTIVAVMTEDRPTTPIDVLPDVCMSDAVTVLRN